jgi:hypothetical protein
MHVFAHHVEQLIQFAPCPLSDNMVYFLRSGRSEFIHELLVVNHSILISVQSDHQLVDLSRGQTESHLSNAVSELNSRQLT